MCVAPHVSRRDGVAGLQIDQEGGVCSGWRRSSRTYYLHKCGSGLGVAVHHTHLEALAQ